MSATRKMRMDLLVFCNQLNMIGVRCLSAYLKSKGVDVRIIYMVAPADVFKDIFPESLHRQIIDYCKDSDLVGLSVTSNYFPEARKFTAEFKKRCDTPVVFGGVHPTIEVEESLEYADYVIMGEGEEAAYELIAALAQKKDPSAIANLAFTSGGRVVKNTCRPLVTDLNSLPTPDFDYTSHLIVDGGELKPITEDLMKKHMLTHSNVPRVTYNISTTRGCPHSCTYCVNYAYKEIYGAKGYVRKRGVDNAIGELKAVIERYPFIEYIFLADETFFIQPMEVVRAFAEQYKLKIARPLKVEFSPPTFSEEKLVCMLEAGAVELHVGVESGSDRTNDDLYARRFPVEKIKSILNTIQKYKKRIEIAHIHILICNPFETLANVKETFRFLVDVPGIFDVRFFPLVFFPGTKLLAMAKEAGIIRDKEKDVYLKTWSEAEALGGADYYTICMMYLFQLKKRLGVGQLGGLLFYSFMTFPLVELALDNKCGKSALVAFHRFLQAAWQKVKKSLNPTTA